MRLDNYLVEKGFFDSRTKAKQAISRGEIYIDNKVVTKSSFDTKDFELNIKRVSQNDFVSLGGFKLEKALNDFCYNPENMIAADIGASTGGFTQCLLNHGAKKVYSVDLNDTLLHDKLKSDNRVIPIIKNAKELQKTDFFDNLDLIVADLSFISLTQVLNVFKNLIDDKKDMIILIKPQFETGKKIKFKNGIIKDDKIHKEVLKKVYDFATNLNLAPQKITSAPIVEGKNIEYLIWLKKNGVDKLKENFNI